MTVPPWSQPRIAIVTGGGSGIYGWGQWACDPRKTASPS